MPIDLTPTPGGLLRRTRLSMRLAGRDIRTHRGRSALIVALIALPIMGISLGSTVLLSALPTPEDTARAELGSTQGRLTAAPWGDGPVVQSTDGDQGNLSGGVVADFTPAPPAETIPPGYTALPWSTVQLTVRSDDRDIALDATASDVLNPAFRGRYTLLEGRAPERSDEALAAPGFLAIRGVKLGDTISTSVGALTLTGTIRDATRSDSSTWVYVTPEQIPPDLRASARDTDIYLVGERALGWKDAKAANAHGVVLTSRDLPVNPPTNLELTEDIVSVENNNRFMSLITFTGILALIGALALFEVCLLAGSAFAMGARRQQRDLALLAASGAETASLRQIITASGVWLGLVGGIVGSLLGCVAGTAFVMLQQSQGSTRFLGVHVAWQGAIVAMLAGTLAGLIAAAVPARQVARQATLGALKGGRSGTIAPRKSTIVGLVLLILAVLLLGAGFAVALATQGTLTSNEWTLLWWGLIIAGALTLASALIVLCGPVIAALSTRAGRFPLPLRLAARDAGRNRGRATPAVAAVLAAATLAGMLMVTVASYARADNENYRWSANPGQAVVPLVIPSPAASAGEPDSVNRIDPGKVLEAVEATVSTAPTSRVISGADSQSVCAADAGLDSRSEQIPSRCEELGIAWPLENRCVVNDANIPLDLTDWRCQGIGREGPGSDRGLPLIMVGDPQDLAAVLGHKPSPESVHTLENGGIVVSNPVLMESADRASLIRYHNRTAWSAREDEEDGVSRSGSQPRASATLPLPASVEQPDRDLTYYGMISPETAAALGIAVTPQVQILTFADTLTDVERARAAEAAGPIIPNGRFSIETGPTTFSTAILWWVVLGAALVTLSAAGITAGLSLADGRADHATLAGVGASTRLRRSLAGAQTLLTAGLGTALGLIAGAIPAILIFTATWGAPLAIPWVHFLALLVVVPLVGALAAWLLTRGSLPLTRRQTLV
ncbi:putative ABC transport system permease protein [Mycetocola sp. BIGb0189]|uniref:ABC transporter permease n=1 Tax=Mycetocola sp. BIGb0189 TaxID=2940604 RepID=UPI00216AA1A8|nr:ABC transporter permease [Mycetocola sp. BIGb0189]MCS4276191.1 putative ABC transport system permease protein [Mycetocola sp. BIGb0189]